MHLLVHSLKGIGTVRWSWTNDYGNLHSNKFKNVVYFTDSPINILSATVLAESRKEDKGTWVIKKEIFYFYLEFWEVQKHNSSLRNIYPKIRDSSSI